MSKTLKIIEATVLAGAMVMIVPAFLVIECKLLFSQLLVPVVSLFLLFGLVLVRRYRLEKALFLTLFPLVIAVQFLLGYLLEVNHCSWDVYTVVKSAREWSLGEPINTFYFSQYPGNIPIMLVLSWVFKVTRWACGSMSLQFLIALNILCLDLAILAMVRLTARISNERVGYFAGLLSFLYVPFYLYIPICYTDIYCMPFLFWGAWQAVDLIDWWRSGKKIGLVAVLKVLSFVLLLSLGAQIKMSCIVLLLAFMIVAGLRLPIKRFALCAILVLVACLMTNKAFNVFVESCHVVTREEIERNSFPMLHNIVMGLAGNGRYCREDVRYTQSFHSYAEKEKALVRKFGKRLFEMGPGGVVKQCFRKSVDTWGAGLCFAEWYLYEGADKPVRENVLHQWIALKGSCHDRLTGIANGVRCLLLLFVMVDMFCALFRKEENSRLLLHLLTAGTVTLLMLWETHPRYTIHYTLALIAVAATRMAMILDWRPSRDNDKERIGIGWQGKAMLRVEVALKELLADDMDAADNEHELLVRLASEPAPPPRKIKTIAIFYHRFYAGGIERVISEQFRYFLESGYKVVLITETPPTDADFPVPTEVPRELVPATVTGRLEALRDIFERHEVDLYYTHASFARQTLWDLLIVRFLLHRRVVIHAHGIFPCSLVWDEDNLQYRIDLYRLADKLIVLTRADVFYYGAYGIDSVYLPNPLPVIEKPVFSADSRFSARVVLAVGRVCSVKRTLDVLKVAAELQTVDPTIKFLIIGSHEDAVYWRQVQSFYNGKALGATVNFLPYTTDIGAEYRKGSMLMVTSQLEGFPMVMAEAKGFALPVVSYDLPYVEFFRQKHSGIIAVPQGDCRAMAQEVKRILDDRALYGRLARESRDSYDRIVSENDLKASYEKIVKELENRVDAERHSQCEDARAAFEALVQQMRERCRLVAAREYRLGGEAMRRSLAGRAMKFSLIASAASWPFRMATRTWYTMRTLGVKATWHKIKEKINALQRRFFRK